MGLMAAESNINFSGGENEGPGLASPRPPEVLPDIGKMLFMLPLEVEKSGQQLLGLFCWKTLLFELGDDLVLASDMFTSFADVPLHPCQFVFSVVPLHVGDTMQQTDLRP